MLRGPDSNTAIIGQPIRTVPLAEGVRPVEFGVAGYPTINYSEEPNTLRILGDETGVFASGFHLGHPVVEIVK